MYFDRECCISVTALGVDLGYLAAAMRRSRRYAETLRDTKRTSCQGVIMKKFLAGHGCSRCLRGARRGRRSRRAALHQGAAADAAPQCMTGAVSTSASMRRLGHQHKCYFNAPNAATFVGTQSYDTTGGIAGGVVGYNWQSGAFVFGLEGDTTGLTSTAVAVINVGPPNLARYLLHAASQLRPLHRPGRLAAGTTPCSTSRAARRSATSSTVTMPL